MAIALLVTMLLAGCSLFWGKADARADFSTVADRNTRYDLPYYGDVNGSAWQLVVDWWKGTNFMGNLGIGDGSRTNLVGGTTKNETLIPANIGAGRILSDSPTPVDVYFPPSKQFPDIFREHPIECGTIYGKLVGLRTPGGHVVDMAIRSLGAEYTQPCKH